MNDGNCCSNESGFKESVCIHTDKIYDSCRDKDCLENLRVYFTAEGQCLVDRAISVKCNKAEIIWVFSDIEAVPFNRGCYSVDLKYFFKVTFSVFAGGSEPCDIEGLAVFNKRSILFGSEGNAKVFSSQYKEDAFDVQLWKKTNLPTAVVEVVDPIVLGAKLVDASKDNCCCDDGFSVLNMPRSMNKVFGGDIVVSGEEKRVYVSLGIFSIVRLERRVMLLIPAYDFCMPDKECHGSNDDPCDLFERISFPVSEFFPPEKSEIKCDDKSCDCGC